MSFTYHFRPLFLSCKYLFLKTSSHIVNKQTLSSFIIIWQHTSRVGGQQCNHYSKRFKTASCQPFAQYAHVQWVRTIWVQTSQYHHILSTFINKFVYVIYSLLLTSLVKTLILTKVQEVFIGMQIKHPYIIN